VPEPVATPHLHERIASRVDAWRGEGYPHVRFPAIGEILEWARETTVAVKTIDMLGEEVLEVRRV